MTRVLFILTVLLSVLSQLPYVLESGLDVYFKLSWVPLTVVLLIKRPMIQIDKRVFAFGIFAVLFTIYCAILEVLFDKPYISAGGDPYNIAISFMIFMDSYLFGLSLLSERFYKLLILVLLVALTYMAGYVYVEFLSKVNIGELMYAYSEKNSIGQILFAAGLLSLLALKSFRNKVTRIGIVAALIFLLIVIFMLKSRATIICLFLVAMYFAFIRGSLKQRIIIACIFLFAIAYVMLNKEAYTVVVENILFANRDVDSADKLSSGRVTNILAALKSIEANAWLGVGHSYLDCMPVAILLQYGVFGCGIVMTFLLYMAAKVNQLPSDNELNVAAKILLWSYMLNSLFEAYPPFGPGVKCFILWMIIGFAFSKDQPRDIRHKHTITKWA